MARQKIDYLTDRQEEILRVIRRWVADQGEYPTLTAIGAEMGFSARSSVHYQLQRMEQLGAVTRGQVGRRNVYRPTG